MEPVSISDNLGSELLMNMGKMTEAVIGLRRDVEAMRDDLRDKEREDVATRKSLYNRLDDMDRRMTSAESNVAAMTKQMREDVVPVIDKLKALEQRGLGVMAVVGLSGTIFGSALFNYISTNWSAIVRALRGF